MANNNILARFTMDIITQGAITLPNLLIKCYKNLQLNEMEMFLLLHLWRFKQEEQKHYPLPEEIALYMTISSSEVQALLADLIEKKVLSIEHYYDNQKKCWINQFSFSGLFDKLAETWACLKAQELQGDESSNLKFESIGEEVMGNIFQAFEKEFGRLLSPFESNQILDWCHKDAYDPELILEALKRSILRGIKNFKYIDSILQDWAKNEVKTTSQLEQYEQKFQAKNQQKKAVSKRLLKKETELQKKSGKYKDVYLS